MASPTFRAGRSTCATAALHAGLTTDRHYRGGSASFISIFAMCTFPEGKGAHGVIFY